MRIYIGYDEKESVSYYTLAHSLHTRSSIPLEIAPLNRTTLRECFTRERGPLESTDFSLSRFMVPFLCGFRGWALFMDCDMLARADIAELASYVNLANWYKAVLVAKHDYIPRDEEKFLGHQQTKYKRKNWSSVMLFNNERCKALTPEYVNSATGLELHQFKWTNDEQIGSLPVEWNWLVEEYAYKQDAKCVHFTRGGPWFREYRDCQYSTEWFDTYYSMVSVKQ